MLLFANILQQGMPWTPAQINVVFGHPGSKPFTETPVAHCNQLVVQFAQWNAVSQKGWNSSRLEQVFKTFVVGTVADGCFIHVVAATNIKLTGWNRRFAGLTWQRHYKLTAVMTQIDFSASRRPNEIRAG